MPGPRHGDGPRTGDTHGGIADTPGARGLRGSAPCPLAPRPRAQPPSRGRLPSRTWRVSRRPLVAHRAESQPVLRAVAGGRASLRAASIAARARRARAKNATPDTPPASVVRPAMPHRSTTASSISPNPRRRKSAEDPVPSPRHMSERQRRHRPATPGRRGRRTRFRSVRHTPHPTFTPESRPSRTVPGAAHLRRCTTLRVRLYDGSDTQHSYNTPLSISRPPPGRMTMTTELSTNHLGRNSLGPTVQQPVRHIAIASGHLDTMLIWGILSVLMGVAWKDGGSFPPSLVPRTDRIDAVMVASMDSQSASTGQG